MSVLMDFIHKTYGAQLVGTLVATFLSGMNTVQTVVYFRVYPGDTARLKVLVTAVWGLDIIHTAFLWSDLWFYLITSYGQTFEIDVIHKPDIVPGAIVVCSILVLIVHMFYVQRIFCLSHRNYWITMPVFILVLCDVVCSIGAAILLYRFHNFLGFIDSGYAWIFSLGFIFAAVSDMVIMVILFVLLRISRQRAISLNNVIDHLVLYILETGSLTAVMAIAIMIMWLTEQRTDIYLGIYMSLPKVYATALLGLLHTRYYLRHGRDSHKGQGPQGHNMIRVANPVHCSGSTNLPMQASEASTEIQHQHIHIDVAKSVWIDEEESKSPSDSVVIVV